MKMVTTSIKNIQLTKSSAIKFSAKNKQLKSDGLKILLDMKLDLQNLKLLKPLAISIGWARKDATCDGFKLFIGHVENYIKDTRELMLYHSANVDSYVKICQKPLNLSDIDDIYASIDFRPNLVEHLDALKNIVLSAKKNHKKLEVYIKNKNVKGLVKWQYNGGLFLIE